MYKLFKDKISGWEAIIRTTDKATIPINEANTDYQDYLKWVAEGNTPEPAENT
jgi:hypothetical protein